MRIERLKKREEERFGKRIEPGGDMYEHHQEFIRWASAYDNGGLNMRSKAKHDEWQKLLLCPLIRLDDSDSLEHNFKIVQRYL